MTTTMLAWWLAALSALLQSPAAPTAPKQAVVDTSSGTFVIDLAPGQAPATAA